MQYWIVNPAKWEEGMNYPCRAFYILLYIVSHAIASGIEYYMSWYPAQLTQMYTSLAIVYRQPIQQQMIQQQTMQPTDDATTNDASIGNA